MKLEVVVVKAVVRQTDGGAKLTDEELQHLKGEELEKIVDEDLRCFDTFFQNRVDNSPLRQEEKALLKTYLWWKTHPS